MTVKQIVIDSSVALKWRLLDEEATEQADMLLADFLAKKLDLMTPNLFDYEITNALKVAVMMNRISEEDAISSIFDFRQYEIERFQYSKIQERSFQLACRYQRSVYDSAYLSLAQLFGIWFYTGDKRLFNAVGGALEWVKWIGDYSLNEIPVLLEQQSRDMKTMLETMPDKLVAYGKQEGKKEIAINLLKKGMEISFISETTKLEEAEVAQLQKQLEEQAS